MGDPNDKFGAAIGGWVKTTKKSADTLTKRLVLDALTGVVTRSPVDTGFFKSNWKVGIGAPDISVSFAFVGASTPPGSSQRQANSQAAGRFALQLGRAVIEKIKAGQKVFISNSVYYASALEAGSSKLAPSGMARLTFADVQSSVSRTVAEVRSSPDGTL